MLPDPGCYEERYRLTGRATVRLAAGLLLAAPGIVWQSRVMSVTAVIVAIPVVFSLVTVLFAMPEVIATARRMIAFRADYAGITLGHVPDNLAALRSPATFIPWAEVEKIILYPARPRGPSASAPVERIAVKRREEAGALVPRPATQTARAITGWQLDRHRLTAVAAAVAPGIPVIHAGGGPDPP